jgi:hypothetical protein
MAVDERVLQVVQFLYGAAVDENLWPGTLRELTNLTGSQGAYPIVAAMGEIDEDLSPSTVVLVLQ